MKIEAYLFFPGNSEEAIGFYASIFGGTVEVMRVSDANPQATNEQKNRVINASLSSSEFVLRASDREDVDLSPSTRIALTIVGSETERLTTIFEKLSQGGIVISALKQEFWGDTFGVVTDRYGLNWQINITAS